MSRCTPSEHYVIYDPESMNRGSEAWTIKSEPEDALQQGELTPYFEPVVSTDFNDNIIAAASALAWNSPNRGLLGFSKLMTMARESEMLKPVYWHCFKGVIEQAARWEEPIGVVLPIPVELLSDDEAVMQLTDTLDLYNLAPERLTIEVPEAALANADCRVVLEVIRQNKIAVRISGMGEGGLPLIMLANLPVDEISVARALLSKSIPPALRTLVLELFKRTGYRLVATGIQDQKLVPKLKELGFHAIQGAAAGSILPCNEFADWLTLRVRTSSPRAQRGASHTFRCPLL